MPELPEVETILRGITPHIQGAMIDKAIIRTHQLRWPIPDLSRLITQQTILSVSRRGKYLLVRLNTGTVLIHLGMSGRLCLLTEFKPPQRHDHVDIIFTDKQVLRFTDPRRFGAILWTENCPLRHPLLKNLGVEPLTDDLNADYLLQRTINRRVAIKPLIMDSKMVVGIGNIYAAEALFLAGIHPAMPAGLLTKKQAQRLIEVIKHVLALAITQGGTTLKDFVDSDGRPGYFAQQLLVYGRAGLPCVTCGKTLQSSALGQRSTVYCVHCQPLSRD
jgi:formamidopyrimidine-DNA glycosylase